MRVLFLILVCTVLAACGKAQKPNGVFYIEKQAHGPVNTGAEQTDKYLPLLQGKRVAVIANQTSIIGHQHLVDSLLKLGVNIVKVFGPEHGFRGNHSDGAHVSSEKDARTGLPVVSLYGKNQKPTAEQLSNVDVILFDIQDVGCRFYTYISTMSLAMEAAAENGKDFLVLDRPNPNGFYVDGPVLQKGFESFVGMHPIPIVHGMTVGEYAKMVNGEGWLKNGVKCRLNVIPCKNYTHKMQYTLPVAPSPNLPSRESILLYPTLCLFEGTDVSIGRGTATPFEIVGAPWWKEAPYVFTPKSIPGASENPKFKGLECRGYNLHEFSDMIRGIRSLYLFWLLDAYKNCPDKSKFFTSYFEKLAGSNALKEAIVAGKSEEEIRASWQDDLATFKQIRAKYLLYPDFE
jgi:uncharacterized protein YbbC (DUF1343 family)